MKKGLCYIIGAGEMFGAPSPKEGDFVIAADGGRSACEALGIKPDLLIGDFDSSERPADAENVIVLPREKDDTDMLAAVKEGLSLGYRGFAVYGGTGGRIDHTLANIQTLSFLISKGARGWLVGNGTIITAISDGGVSFGKDYSGYISAFAAGGKARGVYEKGLKYALSDAVLEPDFPLGVSNEFTGEESAVSVGNGTLILTYPDRGEFI